MFLIALDGTSVKDIYFYSRLYNIYYSLTRQGNEDCSSELNENTIGFSLLEDVKKENAKHKVYQSRFDKESCNLCIDASYFGITNVKEAVDFVSKMINISINR